MKKILNLFFVVLGVIFLIIILAGTYFYITDPLNLKPIIFGTDNPNSDLEVKVETKAEVAPLNKNPGLNEAQEKALESVGVDPVNVPTQFTPEQISCFESILGVERVAEIKSGATPTAMEYFKAKDCI